MEELFNRSMSVEEIGNTMKEVVENKHAAMQLYRMAKETYNVQ